MEQNTTYRKHIKNLFKYQYLKTVVDINNLINNTPISMKIIRSKRNLFKTTIKLIYKNKEYLAVGESPNRFKSILRAKSNMRKKLIHGETKNESVDKRKKAS